MKDVFSESKGVTKVLIIGVFLCHILFITVLAYINQPWFTGDSERYLSLAYELIENGRYGLVESSGYQPELMRSIGYPTFLSLLILFSKSHIAIIISQALLYIISLIIGIRVCQLLFPKDEKTIQFLCIILLSYPFYAYSATHISPDLLCVFLLILMVKYLIKDWRKVKYLFLAGVLLGLSILVRPNYVLFPLFVLGTLFYFHRRDIHSFLKSSAFFIVGLLITVSPQIFHNSSHFNSYSYIPLVGKGISLYISSWEVHFNDKKMINYGMKDIFSPEMEEVGMKKQIAEINKLAKVPLNTNICNYRTYETNEAKFLVDKYATQYALTNIMNSPGKYIINTLKKSIRMWGSFSFPENIPFIVAIFFKMQLIILFFFFLWGVISTFINLHKTNLNFGHIISILLLIYMIITLSPLHIEARYSLPARFIFLIYSAKGIAEFFSYLKLFSKKKSNNSVSFL